MDFLSIKDKFYSPSDSHTPNWFKFGLLVRVQKEEQI